MYWSNMPTHPFEPFLTPISLCAFLKARLSIGFAAWLAHAATVGLQIECGCNVMFATQGEHTKIL